MKTNDTLKVNNTQPCVFVLEYGQQYVEPQNVIKTPKGLDIHRTMERREL